MTDKPATARKRLIVLACFLTALVVFCLGGLAFFYAYLPTYVESRFIPRIAKDMGLEEVVCDVRRIGFTGADMGSIRVGHRDKPTLTIDSVRLDYSLPGLVRAHVNKLVVSGIALYCEFENGKWAIRGLDVRALFPETKPKETARQGSEDTLPAFSFGVLEVRNTVLSCNRQGRVLRIPVDLEVELKEKQKHDARCDLRMDLWGQRIALAGHVRLKEKTVALALDARGLALERFASLADLMPGLSIWGEGDLKGEARFGLDPWAVGEVFVSCELRNSGMAYQELSFQTVSKDGSGNSACGIQFKFDGAEATFYMSGIAVQSPVPLALSDIRSTLRDSAMGYQATGDYWLTVAPFTKGQGEAIGLLKPVRWKGKYFAMVGKEGAWECRLEHDGVAQSGSGDLEMTAGGVEITSRLPALKVEAKGLGGEGSAKLEAGIPVLSARAGPQTTLGIPLTGLKGDMAFHPSGEGSMRLNLEMADAELGVGSVKALVPQVSVSGRFLIHPDRPLTADGRVTFKDAQMRDPAQGLEVRGVNGDLPFTWPNKEVGDKGAFLVGSMRWKGLNLGDVKGTVSQKGVGVVFEGKHENALFPGLTMRFAGASQVMASHGGNDTKMHFEIPPFKTPSPVDLGKFHPALKDVFLDGSVALKGNWRRDSRGGHGSLQGKLYDARLEMGGNQNRIDGLSIDLSSFDLGTMRSTPMQQVQFEKALFGGLEANDGRIGFQIESAQSFFVEKGSFKWCGGSIYMEALRLSSDSEFYDMVLYGDRLNLAMVLEQFGVAKAQGQGTVNGRIPVRLGKGKIRFGEGFLFSTPGDGGTINLSGTEMITAGIPPETPQYAQMELAREALKDFDYEWAKVTLATEEDNLVLRMQFNGKPAKPLPFVYKKELGSFVKIKEGQQNSVFQGIRLDVNFRLPIDKLLHYSDIFQKMFKGNE